MQNYKLYDLSHPWGFGCPLWPYFPDIKIERFHTRIMIRKVFKNNEHS